MTAALGTIGDLEQWQLLLTVSRLFGSDVPWRIIGAKGCDDDIAKESADLFKVYVGEIPVHVPTDHILSKSSKSAFLRGIHPLLDMLEQIVTDAIHNEDEATNFDSYRRIPRTGLEEMYPKLCSLSRLMTIRASTESATGYTRFICLDQSAADLKRMRSEVCCFNADMRTTLGNSGSSVPVQEKPLHTEGPMLKAQNWFKPSFCADSNRLFDSLSAHLQLCKATPEHSAMLHLKHFPQLESSAYHLELSMLFQLCSSQRSSSPSQSSWQEMQCIVPSDGYGQDVEGCDAPVDSVCQQTHDAYAAGEIFAIQLCKQGFSDISESRINQGPTHPDATPTLALSNLLDRGILRDRYRFYPTDKKILAYNLAQSLLAFHEGPWLQRIWTLDNIFFLHDPDEKKVYDIHHPYVSCVLSQEPRSMDTLMPRQRYPLIFSFAKLLVELETGQEVKSKGRLGYRSTLQELCNDWSNNQLDQHYASALRACVFFEKYFKQDRLNNGNTTIRDTIFNHIVDPLEKIVNTSKQNEWGLRDLYLDSSVTTIDRQPTLRRSPQSSRATDPSPPQNTSDSIYHSFKRGDPWTYQSVTLSQTETTKDHHTSCDEGARPTSMLFDANPDEASEGIISGWKSWLSNFQRFRKRILPHPLDTDTHQRIRITVIDTGIDESHPYIRRHWSCNDEDSVTGYLFRDFVAADQSHEHPPVDQDGHGTFIAGILLQVAPHVELSIARIGATRKSIEKDAQIDHKVGSAIQYAIDKWEANIISLSFGSEETLSYATRNALNEAKLKNVIVLAAAGNAGNQSSIPYPASKNGVFKIFPVDAFGKWAAFTTPPPKEHRNESFFIFGCGVVSTWPPSLQQKAASENLQLICYTKGHQYSENQCGDRCDIRTVMSGSSFATPIAAALVALIYQFYDENEEQFILSDGNRIDLKTREAVHVIFNKMSIFSSDLPYMYLNPLRGYEDYFKYGLFELHKKQTYIEFFSGKLFELLFRAKV